MPYGKCMCTAESCLVSTDAVMLWTALMLCRCALMLTHPLNRTNVVWLMFQTALMQSTCTPPLSHVLVALAAISPVNCWVMFIFQKAGKGPEETLVFFICSPDIHLSVKKKNVRELHISSYFHVLSCANTRWRQTSVDEPVFQRGGICRD